MSLYSQLLDNALSVLEASEGATLEWNGTTYPCVIGDQFQGKRLDAGGFTLDNAATVTVRRSLFSGGATPQTRQTVIVTREPGAAAENYMIRGIRQPWGLLVLELSAP